MNDNQRQQIRDNAKYLRNVRPIDPDEIYEYVEGQPHPAVVRQVLRESATELGLIERSDGAFEPASTGPAEVTFEGVKELPEYICQEIEGQLIEEFGPGWPDGTSGDRLRAAIRDFKRQYLHGGAVTYDGVTAFGYAIYHLPAYFAATQYVLSELADSGKLTGHMRVLDVGAGVGGPALAVDALLPDDALVEYHAVEPSDGADLLGELLELTGDNFRPTVHRERIQRLDLDREFDLILCANVLSELEDPETTLQTLLEWLDPAGTLCAISPADKNTATRLRRLERTAEAEAGATVYSPTVRLWPHQRPESTCWSFDRRAALTVPPFQQKLDEGERSEGTEHAVTTVGEGKQRQVPADDNRNPREPGDGEFVNTDVQFAYSMLRVDGATSIDLSLDSGQFARMAETERHVTDRVDYVAIKLSRNLADSGNPLYLIADGSEKLDHFAVLTEESLLNQELSEAAYGDLLQFENVLVLWNDDEGAYNLVVDGETIVDRIPV